MTKMRPRQWREGWWWWWWGDGGDEDDEDDENDVDDVDEKYIIFSLTVLVIINFKAYVYNRLDLDFEIINCT